MSSRPDPGDSISLIEMRRIDRARIPQTNQLTPHEPCEWPIRNGDGDDLRRESVPALHGGHAAAGALSRLGPGAPDNADWIGDLVK